MQTSMERKHPPPPARGTGADGPLDGDGAGAEAPEAEVGEERAEEGEEGPMGEEADGPRGPEPRACKEGGKASNAVVFAPSTGRTLSDTLGV